MKCTKCNEPMTGKKCKNCNNKCWSGFAKLQVKELIEKISKDELDLHDIFNSWEEFEISKTNGTKIPFYGVSVLKRFLFIIGKDKDLKSKYISLILSNKEYIKHKGLNSDPKMYARVKVLLNFI